MLKKNYYYYHFVFDCLNKIFKENQIKIKFLDLTNYSIFVAMS